MTLQHHSERDITGSKAGYSSASLGCRCICRQSAAARQLTCFSCSRANEVGEIFSYLTVLTWEPNAAFSAVAKYYAQKEKDRND